MVKRNFLLGQGENLVEDVAIRKFGGPKAAPYTFEEARDRLSPMVANASRRIDDLPEEACPQDNAVILLTMNPEYVGSSRYPYGLLQDVGLRAIGSRSKMIMPEKRSLDRKPIEMHTTELFALGPRTSIRNWGQALPDWRSKGNDAGILASIEEVAAPLPRDKIKGSLPDNGRHVFETVLHADELDSYLIQAFAAYLDMREIKVEFGERFFVRGLCFLEIDADVEQVEDIATFTAVRALRQMPGMRQLSPVLRSVSISAAAPTMPDVAPVSRKVRVAIFDAGIPKNHPITKWVNLNEPSGMGVAADDFLTHGVAVTSAALFGHIDSKSRLPRPFSLIDHHRVVDATSNQGMSGMYRVLMRIINILKSKEYDFINLSIGPSVPIDDNDIHAWTAVLDELLSRVSTIAIIAVGNGGELDTSTGKHRVQVPSDCVNALAVGACDAPDGNWNRAAYSSIGPGRSPGRVKPDMVEFGGVDGLPFVVLSKNLAPTLEGNSGTSFSAPSAMRMAVGLRAHFGESLNHLAIRALLVHTCEIGKLDFTEVGWGRLARSIHDIVLCENDTIRIVYQGQISPAKYIRVPIPLPSGQLEGIVTITATICYKSQTDPHYPGSYTRAGIAATFRPHNEKFKNEKQFHSKSDIFFSSFPSRTSASQSSGRLSKWENCLHARRRKQGRSLLNPCFDIHYNTRLAGKKFVPEEKLNYAMIVTVTARGVSDLYNRVVREYTAHLKPIKPVVQIPINISHGN